MHSIVTTPTHAWLEERLRHCRNRFLAASPFVTAYLARVAEQLPTTVRQTLLTRVDLRHFANGSSDLEAVCKVARLGTQVFGLATLHAKVYVIDDSAALVTSANATDSGMRRNLECGIAVDQPTEVASLVELLFSGFGATDRPHRWTPSELERLRESVPIVRESQLGTNSVLLTPSGEYPDLSVAPRQWPGLTAPLPGWMRLTLEAVTRQPNAEFRLDAIYGTCLPIVARRYPNNRFPRDKVRQQMQRLRDLGFVEFHGNGRYRRTIDVDRRA